MSMRSTGIEVRRFRDPEELARGAVEEIVETGGRAVSSQGRFSLALAGGSTPRAAYELLATELHAHRLDWSRTTVFWGDERCVSPDHPDSNYGMAKRALLDRVPIPDSNIYRIRGEIDPTTAAEQYEAILQTSFTAPSGQSGSSSSAPRFDLILLGMGADGHTAALFPGTQALQEKERWVRAEFVDTLKTWRVTLTPPLINSAARVVFLVSGAEKSDRLREVLKGPFRPDLLPAQIVLPADGEVLWLVDEAAAALL